MGFLYRLNFPNGKSYIGMTTLCVTHRVAKHKSNMLGGGRGCILYSAWAKHGDPEVVVLAELPNDKLPSAEVIAIRDAGTLCPSGYNMTIGGETSPSLTPAVAAKISEASMGNQKRLGSLASEETRLKMSLAKAGRKLSAAHRAKLSARKLGNRSRLGQKQSNAERLKRSASLIRYHQTKSQLRAP